MKYKIIGISGKKGSGKTTLANKLRDMIKTENYQILSFSTKLKEICNILYPNNNNDKLIYQTVGEHMRKLDPNIWINLILNNIDNNKFGYIIIDDLRYRNEAEELKKRGAFLIRLNNDNNLDDNRDKNHISEIDLDNYDKFDLIMANSDNLSNIKLYL